MRITKKNYENNYMIKIYKKSMGSKCVLRIILRVLIFPKLLLKKLHDKKFTKYTGPNKTLV